MTVSSRAVLYALAAALCYGFSAPLSKLLLARLSPTFLAALLYLGAGLGMLAAYAAEARLNTLRREQPLSRSDLPYLAAMVLLDAAAPILLLWGLQTATPATVALLNNFEIAATALIACWLFGERGGRRLWAAVGLMTAAGILLTVENFRTLAFSSGALLALLASVCWGFENNTTRVLSAKDPLQTVMVKGFGSGTLALAAAACMGQTNFASPGYVAGGLLLGAGAYGCSVYFYILAQRTLGAARTGLYYAAAPFIGVGLSFLLIGQRVGLGFCAAAVLMAAGTYLSVTERPAPLKTALRGGGSKAGCRAAHNSGDDNLPPAKNHPPQLPS